MVRGSANIKDTLTGPRVAARLRTLTLRCMVLALQEWPGSRNGLLAGAGQLVMWPRRPDARTFRPRGAWTFHRARLGGGPIGVRNDQGETPLSCKTKILAGPGYVGRMTGRKSILGPSKATRLKTRTPDGSTKVRYNVHLSASVQNGKAGYRTDEAAKLRVARHRRERAKLERLVARDQRRGHDVEVYGDTNYHHRHIKGLHSWWPLAPDAGTFGSRAIDGIWTTLPPDNVDFLAPLVSGEHRSVITEATR
jgi:hypothetical protein